MSKLRKLLIPASLLMPFFALALSDIDYGNIVSGNNTNSGTTLGTILGLAYNFLKALIPIIMLLALVYFFWGLAKYVLAAGNGGAKEEGRQIMIWGIIALFVMASVWGLVALLQHTVSITGSESVPTPYIPPYTSPR